MSDEQKKAAKAVTTTKKDKPSLLEEIAADSKWDKPIAEYVAGTPDPAVLEQLVELRKREQELDEQSYREQARRAFHKDLLAAQEEMPSVLRRDKSKTGAGGDYTWTSLAKAVRDVLPVFNRHGFSIGHSTRREGKQVYIVTAMEHELGHVREFEFPLLADTTGSKSAPQASGSGTTYARRYGLSAVCGFATEEMDDGDDPATQPIEETEEEIAAREEREYIAALPRRQRITLPLLAKVGITCKDAEYGTPCGVNKEAKDWKDPEFASLKEHYEAILALPPDEQEDEVVARFRSEPQPEPEVGDDGAESPADDGDEETGQQGLAGVE